MARRKPGSDGNLQPVRRGARNFWRGISELVAVAQFDVFANPSSRGVSGRPFVVVIQADLLSDSPNRLVTPLVVAEQIKPMGRLNPRFEIEGRTVYLQPLEVAALSRKLLRKPVTNLEEYRYQIVSALDLVFLGI